MSHHKEQRKGELLIFGGSFLGSFYPIIIVLTYTALSGIASLAWTTLFAAIMFGFVIIYRRRFAEFKDPRVWKLSGYATLLIGVLYYSLYFIGLQYTTPGNAAIIILFQTFTSFLFFQIYRKDLIPRQHLLGAGLMVVGAFVIVMGGFDDINIGDILILLAQFLAPVGNYFQQQARKIASSETILFLRSAFSALFLFVLMHFIGLNEGTSTLYSVLPLLILIAVLSSFERVLWMEAIHRISVTKATALYTSMPFFTLIFAWIILRQIPTIWQFASLPFLIFGVLLLTDQWKRRRAESVSAV